MHPFLIPQGRAVTAEQKREVIERIYAAWCATPELRLGQLLLNACSFKPGPPPHIAEDQWLAEVCEVFANRKDGGWRADEKGNALEDLRKARWYIEREIARREKEASW